METALRITAFIAGLLFLSCEIAIAQTLSFSGYDWVVRQSKGVEGPGPNTFSSDGENVWVDNIGRLHLRITKSGQDWKSAEVFCKKSLGYGEYRFYMDQPVDALDPNVIFGLFVWNDAPDYNHREIDVEFAKWGLKSVTNAQYTVQPVAPAANYKRFEQRRGIPSSSHSFHWQPSRVTFRSLYGKYTTPPTPQYVTSQWSYTGSSVPVPGGETVHLNLWLFKGQAPTDGKPVEVVINGFEFVPGRSPSS